MTKPRCPIASVLIEKQRSPACLSRVSEGGKCRIPREAMGSRTGTGKFFKKLNNYLYKFFILLQNFNN
jgi:hypothetical protein